ncbi:MAG: SH3 domain-containing protein [Rickettsiales bacterium]|jgi:SH3-like domain-containing protein|nr:SH3 domain-containing protein [Rickettsiales bacterium]
MHRLIFTIIVLFCWNTLAVAPSFTENFVSYYASIKSSEVNVRKGPNTRYPIEWVFKKKGEPVEVIAQFEHWYKIKDFSGDEGWVKSAMLTKKRRGIISIKFKKDNPNLYVLLYDKPDASSQVIAKIAHSKRVDVTKCNKNWCQIKIVNLSGWVEKSQLWGVYAKEEFK